MDGWTCLRTGDYLWTSVNDVIWKETDTILEERMSIYLPYFSSVDHLHIRRNSAGNTFVMILVLTGGLVTFYMRVLKKNFMEHTYDEVLADNQEEKGWNLLQSLVLALSCLLSNTELILILGLVGIFYQYDRGKLLTALVARNLLLTGCLSYGPLLFTFGLLNMVAISYKVTAALPFGTILLIVVLWMFVAFPLFILGKTARNLLLTGCLSYGPLLFTFGLLNMVAISYKVTAALPFGTILLIVVLWMFVAFPLFILGKTVGENWKVEFQAPCHTTKFPREIPPSRWYSTGVFYVELYHIIWGYKFYSINSIIVVVFIILLIVTALVTVALTYFQLAAEDHQWWWRSFLCGGSTGLYVFGYCIYYYYALINMSGLLQTSFCFGCMACICYSIFLMLGTVGFSCLFALCPSHLWVYQV
ncbi:transmembrane 9 superfamily member 3 [Quercus suber]|uniref:Transmembrane 9 superfamily member n=1 Tax=Quercus suber TaxID=58331 RepID=A0AAW0LD54_QUESU